MTLATPAGAEQLLESIEASKRIRRRNFLIMFGLTWAVIVIGLSVFLQVTVGLNLPFLNEWAPFMLGFVGFPGGVILTLFISVVSIFFAVILAVFGALGRLSSNPFLNGIASLYVSVVRGTPLIVQIFFIYLGLPAAGIVIPEIPTGILALSFNYGAYLTEVFRAGIQAVPYGQTEAARSLGCGDAGLEAAETVIRAGMLKLGCGVLGELLSADRGHRGPAVPCGNGHEALFVSYRDKVIDTVLGPVTLNRAWYHCPACKHGFAPRDAELGVAGTSLSPGLTAMNDKAAAAGPFAGAASMLEDLAGVRLTVKRTERAAEASGAAYAAQVRGRSA